MRKSFYQSFRFKMVAFLFLAIAVTTFIAVYFTYNASKKNIEAQSGQLVQTSVERLARQFDNFVGTVHKSALPFTTNRELWDLLRADDALELDMSFSWLRNQLSSFRTLSPHMYSVFLVDFNKKAILSTIDGVVYAADNPLAAEYIARVFAEQERVPGNNPKFVKDDGSYFKQFSERTPTRDTYALLVPIRDMVLGSRLGLMVFNFSEGAIAELYAGAEFGPGSAVYLADEAGVILSAGNPSRIGGKLPTVYGELVDGTWRKVEAGGADMLIATANTSHNGWRFVAEVPFQPLIRDSQQGLRLVISYSLAAVAMFAVVILLLLRRFFYRPFHKLLQEVRLTDSGSVPSPGMSALIARQDEIGYIFRSFVQILGEKEELLKSNYEQQTVIQDTRIRLLYSQINPHFLYNTLDNIRWMAMDLTEGENEVSRTIRLLSDMLRAGAKVEQQVVSLESELAFVRNYVAVQRIRHGDRLKVDWDVPDEALPLPIIKFLIQPLVENAISHGVEQKEGAGLISVTLVREDERLIIRVVDDGAGMDADALEALRTRIESGESVEPAVRGIGLRNIRERIRLYYGDEGAIGVESDPGKGTTVQLIIPIRTMKAGAGDVAADNYRG